jgi:hypothetical protein
VASQVLFPRVMVTVKSGGGGPRRMTTVTLPLPLAVADKTWGAPKRPFGRLNHLSSIGYFGDAPPGVCGEDAGMMLGETFVNPA